MINLNVRPAALLHWHDFVRENPAFSIALDGYVRGAPKFDASGPHANFNHHEDVDRLSTRSTCAQVLTAIRMGLFQKFRDEGGARAEVFVNDCDEDVCLSWALLERPDLAEGLTNPNLNRLVFLEDMLDCTAGMYPLHKDAGSLQELAWVFEPYRLFRASGQLDRRDPSAFRSTITDVCSRVQAYLVGRGKRISLDTRYECLYRGSGWTAVREVGAQARAGMFSDGIRVFVAVRERGDGRFTYTVGRSSLFVGPDFTDLRTELNALEDISYPEYRGVEEWGGGNTIFGSPRVSGSRLKPNDVFAEVELACGGRRYDGVVKS